MLEVGFQRGVRPLEPSQIVYMRTQLRYGIVGSCAGSTGPRISTETGLLVFSLAYGAGARPSELSLMRVETLLNDNGEPADSVCFRPETTKHRAARRVPMHPDIARDLRYFRELHPHESWVAFSAPTYGGPAQKPLTESALSAWFRSRLLAAGLNGYSLHSGRKAFCDAARRQAR
jgi:integrase